MGRTRTIALVAAVLAALACAPLAGAAFPGSDPDESVRLNTPNDPDFDRAESDDEQGASSSNVYDEELERFGFAPQATQNTALYKNPQDVARQRAQNEAAGRNSLGQLSGVSADRAWKRSTGRPDVEVAILDTGIRWRSETLRTKVALNEDELPTPQCGRDDCDEDGAFTVDDYASDTRVSKTSGTTDEADADKLLDASDLIAVFSDGRDDDTNGYADDIAGWDFFDDDNDPYDASSYSSASNHGTGRAEEAAQATDDGKGGTGVCPRCRIVPMRIWDTFVADTNNFGLATTYAADNGIEVVEAAIGGLSYTRFVGRAMRDAYARGVFFTVVSSDLNTSDHNSPTTYDEAMMVAGTVADTQGLGQDASEVGGFLGQLGIPTSAPVSTWFRNSGTTQYGERGNIVMPAVTGSQATGQASGAAALVMSYARERGTPLQPNEVKQLLTLTAEDVVPENTVGAGLPDPAQKGWDRHFGYGRPDLGLALERIAEGKVPPQAMLTSPSWFEPFALERGRTVEVRGRLSARLAASFSWELQWAPGAEPAEGDFRRAAEGASRGPVDGRLGTLDLGEVRRALDARSGGGAPADPTEPNRPPGDTNPNEPTFTVRVVVKDSRGERGEDRRALFAHRDGTLKEGWPQKEFGRGGEASQRLWDVDGDNALEVIQADSSGELRVLRADGSPAPTFNQGRPVTSRTYPNVHAAAPAFSRLEPPRESLRTPAIGDIDGDLTAEIVDTAGEHVYAWKLDGSPVAGFPVRLDPALSLPRDRTRDNHVKRGFFASPVLADLSGDAALEIVATALDQHVYAWDGRGRPLPGFPRKLKDGDLDGAEIITTPAVGDLAGDRRPELVTPTAELDDNAQAPGQPSGLGDVASFFYAGLTNLLAQAAGGSGRTYAIDAAGRTLEGWPVKPNGIIPDALPFVGPSVEQVMGDVDGDGKLEVVGNLATGDVQSWNADGRSRTTYDPGPPTGEHVDKSRVLNLFEHPIVADLDGEPGLEVIKGGVTLNQLVNIGVAVGQNLPYNHVIQAWNGRTGASLPAFPQAVEDFQLLSSPSVADASDAGGKEILAGTGLYLLRNINAAGEEGKGWPKFTGGWIYAVPATGDADGDGKLEVAVQTREGNSFLWDTDRPACGGNDEWWTSRHDERSTGTYGTDTRPPGTPRGLTAQRTAAGSTEVTFVAPGDDWLCGKARRYRIVGASAARAARAGQGEAELGTFDVPVAAGERVTRTLDAGARTRLSVMVEDDAGNWGLAAGTQVAPPAAGPAAAAPTRRRPRADKPAAASPRATGEAPAGRLPFTGLELLGLALAGAALTAAGVALRRRLRGGHDVG